ncbi:hypothetical protein ACVW1C_000182 [Bradyrhizobium sp. USDA 4011]
MDEPLFINIPRDLITAPFFRRDGEFGEREAWIWLVAAAAVRCGTGPFGRPVQRSEIDLDRRKLAEQWGWTSRHLDSFLSRLAGVGFIERDADIIRIVDFDAMTVPESDEPAGTTIELSSPSELRAMGVRMRSRESSHIPAAVRREVVLRDGWICQYCYATDGRFHFDHVFPRSRGGADTAANIKIACETCNLRKGARTPEEWRAATS